MSSQPSTPSSLTPTSTTFNVGPRTAPENVSYQDTEVESYFFLKKPAHCVPQNVSTRTVAFPLGTPTPNLVVTPPLDIPRPSLKRSTTTDSSSSFLRKVQQNNHEHRTGHPVSPCFSPPFESPQQSSSASVVSSNDISSSDFLTPPASQSDFDTPPYRASRRDSKSLTMKGSSGRKKRTRKPKSRKRQPFHQNQSPRSDDLKPHENRRNSGRGLPGCQIASHDSQNSCEGDVQSDLPRDDCEMRYKLCQDMQHSASASKRTITRRWSSFEIRAHKDRSTGLVASPSYNDASHPWKHRKRTHANFEPQRDLLASILRMLTTRRVPRMDIPSSITLRRPSARKSVANSNHFSAFTTTSRTPQIVSPTLVEETEIPVAYLITNQDIDSITALINVSLRSDINPENATRPASSQFLAPSITSKRPSITSNGLVPHSGSPAHTTVTKEDVQSPYTLARDVSTRPQIRQRSTLGKQRAVSHAPSTRSLHEILWDDVLTRSSTTSPLSVDLNEKASNPQSPAQTPFFTPRRNSNASDSEIQHKFDHSYGSLQEWKWAYPDPPVSTPHRQISTKSSEYSGLTKPHAYTVRKVSPKSDVISFPPLRERRRTSEWITPLSDITQPEPNSFTLHDFGIDATYGGGSISDMAVQASLARPLMRQRSLSNSDQQMRPTVRLRTSIFNSDQDLQRRSRVNPSRASAGIGASMMPGSSIGASSGVRRKSSIMPHIRFLDYLGSDKAGSTWKKAREDSCYPIVLEPSSPDDDNKHSSSGPSSGGFKAHREKLLKEKTPILPGKIDRAGIYNEFTGSTSAKRPSLMAGGRHNCNNCSTDSESRMPSVDWIG